MSTKPTFPTFQCITCTYIDFLFKELEHCLFLNRGSASVHQGFRKFEMKLGNDQWDRISQDRNYCILSFSQDQWQTDHKIKSIKIISVANF